MAVYRVNKNRSYTVMANYHLRDKNLSLKAVGLLSKMLSFNDGWQFSTKGLSAICKEGPDAVLAALRELEDHGYLVRHRQRDAKGRMSNTVFEIYEQPQPVSPHMGNPDVDNPDMENPHMENPHKDKPAQLNTNQVITKQRNNNPNNYQSINLDGMDRMDEREQYRELIRDNLEIDIRSQDRHYDLDRVNEIVEIMLDAVCSTSPVSYTHLSDTVPFFNLDLDRRSLRHTFIWIRQLSAAEKEVENFYCSARKYTAERICRYSICYGIFPACHLSAL